VKSAWEEALMQETERQELDDVYRPKDMGMLAGDFGLTRVAEKNYKKIKPKLALTTFVGV
jgi:hypothetical protein